MNTKEIRRRISGLQNQINSLVTLLPHNAQLDFHVVDVTSDTDIAERKRLVMTVTEVGWDIGAEVIERARSKR